MTNGHAATVTAVAAPFPARTAFLNRFLNGLNRNRILRVSAQTIELSSLFSSRWQVPKSAAGAGLNQFFNLAPAPSSLSIRPRPRGQEVAMIKFNRPETPFPRHWLVYIVLKFAVLALAVLFVLYLFGVYEVNL